MDTDSTATGDVLTLAEVATRLRLSEKTVRRAVKAGRLRALQLVPGGAVRFYQGDIERFIRGRARARSHLRTWHGETGRNEGG